MQGLCKNALYKSWIVTVASYLEDYGEIDPYFIQQNKAEHDHVKILVVCCIP